MTTDMPKLPPKDKCTGCAACHDVCAHHVISMVADQEGFLYPQIDGKKCVNCRLCERTCPSLNRFEPKEPLAAYAAKASDDELRINSSSGGVFSLLGRQVLANGGMVFGAAFDKTDWSVCHIGVMDEQGLAKLRGSKYVQSRTAGVYRNVEDALSSGRQVLFSGTPCQVAALGHFLGKPYDNLLLVDVVCHAVPSPLAWQRYLAKRSGTAGCLNVREVAFRRKNRGWRNYSLSLRFANGDEYSRSRDEDPFIRAFLSGLCNRPSCHSCLQREFRSGADLTIADYWGVRARFPEMDDDKGASVVFVNTEKGRMAFEQLCHAAIAGIEDYRDVVSANSCILSSMRPDKNREVFFGRLTDMDFDKNVESVLGSVLSVKINRCVLNGKRRIKGVLRRAVGFFKGGGR